jgi:hypothetical protein
MVESKEGAAKAADDGGLDGGAGEGAEAEVEEGSATAGGVRLRGWRRVHAVR